MEKVLTYSEACNMYIDELEEINAAIDIHIENIKKSNKKGGK